MVYEGSSSYLGQQLNVVVVIDAPHLALSIRFGTDNPVEFKSTIRSGKWALEENWLIRPFCRLKGIDLSIDDRDNDGELTLFTLLDKERVGIPAEIQRYERKSGKWNHALLGPWLELPLSIYLEKRKAGPHK